MKASLIRLRNGFGVLGLMIGFTIIVVGSLLGLTWFAIVHPILFGIVTVLGLAWGLDPLNE